MPKTFIHNSLLIALIVFACLIRSINIGKFGLYGDEKYSLMVVNGVSAEGATQPEIFKRNAEGGLQTKYFTPKQFWESLTFSDFDEAIIRTDNGNSSTYYSLLFVWKSMFGQSDGALRWMGIYFDCLTILLIYLFCKNILNSAIIGLLASFFAAIEPFLIAYSHQVRNYPVGIFLIFLSTFLFFKILKNEAVHKYNFRLYFSYGLTVLLGILCHYYVVLFIFSQFIFLIIRYLKNFIVLKRFVITYLITFSFLALWFTIGSGRNTFQTFKEKDLIFLNMIKSEGKNAKEISFITAANYDNIRSKIGPIFTDYFLFSNNILSRYSGWVNLIFCLVLSSLLLLILDISKNCGRLKKNLSFLGFGIIACGIFYPVFSLNPLYYIYLAILIVFVFIIIRFYLQNRNWNNGYLEFSFILILLPIIITIITSVKSGHTANIYQKYMSFGFPIAFIVMAIGINELLKSKSFLAYGFVIIFGIYLINIYKIDTDILLDKNSKYNILEGRWSNPYIFIADELTKKYKSGDTIIFPNTGHTPFDQYDPQMRNDYVSIIDAQLTNIYLPKTANFIQRVEPNEPNKVYLYQQATQRKLLIFDFENRKYRY